MNSSRAPAYMFDRDTWRQLCSLVEGEDTSFLESLFQSYLETALANLATLRSNASMRDQRRAAHTLFGSSMSVGVTSVAVLCRKLELELGRIPVNDLTERLAKIEAQLHRVREQYPMALASVGAGRLNADVH